MSAPPFQTLEPGIALAHKAFESIRRHIVSGAAVRYFSFGPLLLHVALYSSLVLSHARMRSA